jgi:hypothetical protein
MLKIFAYSRLAFEGIHEVICFFLRTKDHFLSSLRKFNPTYSPSAYCFCGVVEHVDCQAGSSAVRCNGWTADREGVRFFSKDKNSRQLVFQTNETPFPSREGKFAFEYVVHCVQQSEVKSQKTMVFPCSLLPEESELLMLNIKCSGFAGIAQRTRLSCQQQVLKFCLSAWDIYFVLAVLDDAKTTVARSNTRPSEGKTMVYCNPCCILIPSMKPLIVGPRVCPTSIIVSMNPMDVPMSSFGTRSLMSGCTELMTVARPSP